MFQTTTSIISGLLMAMAFVFIGSIYLLVEPPGRLIQPVLKFFSPKRSAQLQAAVADLAPRLRWWLIGNVIDMAVIGLASWLGYWLVGLEFALRWPCWRAWARPCRPSGRSSPSWSPCSSPRRRGSAG